MRLFTLEHGRLAYCGDLALYGAASVALAAFLAIAGPRKQGLEIVALAVAGLAGWTLIEYALHRFVMHGLRPFSTWHAEHHRRPSALICTPTVLSAALIVALVYLPAWALFDPWRGCALTFGVLTGYFAFGLTHHAIHHWRPGNAWINRRKRWHALHHAPATETGYYGVTSAFWDHVFGSCRARRAPERTE